jgi:hypothetical protein
MKCSYPGCKSGLTGIVIPVASFKALNAPKYMPRGHAIMQDLRLCEACAPHASIHKLVDDRRWQDICRQLAAAGGIPPDRNSLEMLLGTPRGESLPPMFVEAIKKMRSESPIV